MRAKGVYAGFALSFNTIIIGIFSIMVVVVSLNVFCRYVLNFSLGWADESARLLFILMVFIGSISTHKDDGHFSFDILVKKLPPHLRMVAKVVEEAIITCVLVFVFIAGVKTSIFLTNKTPALGLPIRYIYLAIPISMFAMLIITVHRAIRSVVRYRNQMKSDTQSC
jgi:TRAP-type C4-dicarboxylate transport system permease small subunit